MSILRKPFKLVYTGPSASLWDRLKVWWYLARCRRRILRCLAEEATIAATDVLYKPRRRGGKRSPIRVPLSNWMDDIT